MTILLGKFLIIALCGVHLAPTSVTDLLPSHRHMLFPFATLTSCAALLAPTPPARTSTSTYYLLFAFHLLYSLSLGTSSRLLGFAVSCILSFHHPTDGTHVFVRFLSLSSQITHCIMRSLNFLFCRCAILTKIGNICTSQVRHRKPPHCHRRSLISYKVSCHRSYNHAIQVGAWLFLLGWSYNENFRLTRQAQPRLLLPSFKRTLIT